MKQMLRCSLWCLPALIKLQVIKIWIMQKVYITEVRLKIQPWINKFELLLRIKCVIWYFPKSLMCQATLLICIKLIKLIPNGLLKVLIRSKTRYSYYNDMLQSTFIYWFTWVLVYPKFRLWFYDDLASVKWYLEDLILDLKH